MLSALTHILLHHERCVKHTSIDIIRTPSTTTDLPSLMEPWRTNRALFYSYLCTVTLLGTVSRLTCVASTTVFLPPRTRTFEPSYLLRQVYSLLDICMHIQRSLLHPSDGFSLSHRTAQYHLQVFSHQSASTIKSCRVRNQFYRTTGPLAH